jgi:hypothetical protein
MPILSPRPMVRLIRSRVVTPSLQLYAKDNPRMDTQGSTACCGLSWAVACPVKEASSGFRTQQVDRPFEALEKCFDISVHLRIPVNRLGIA